MVGLSRMIMTVSDTLGCGLSYNEERRSIRNILAQTLLFLVTAAASDTEAVGSATVRLNLGL